jgi:uncharacterized coiled-coil DUF342 family protein
MTRDKLDEIREERDQLIEDYTKALSGRLPLTELQMIAARDRIAKLNKALARLKADNAQGT